MLIQKFMTLTVINHGQVLLLATCFVSSLLSKTFFLVKSARNRGGFCVFCCVLLQ